MMQKLLNAIRLLSIKKPSFGGYDNPYPKRTALAIAWDEGRSSEDGDDNPYPHGSGLWAAWKKGQFVRQRYEMTIW